jgi:site-specific DNA-methyltransferase (adenine-specific)
MARVDRTHGVGALNIDGCRIGTDAGWSYPNGRGGEGWHGRESLAANLDVPMIASAGRWPANVIHDGSDEVVALFPDVVGATSRSGAGWRSEYVGGAIVAEVQTTVYPDTGSAARFFYCAKASAEDRDEGLQSFAARHREAKYGSVQDARPHTPEGYEYHREPRRNVHPTVKPTDLMRYLVRLVTPPGGVVLDPFMGSGSTGKAAAFEGVRFIGIEREPDYYAIAQARIAAAEAAPKQTALVLPMPEADDAAACAMEQAGLFD